MTLSFVEALREYVEREKNKLRVCMPGRVQSYNANTQRADIQPLLDDQVEGDGGDRENAPLPVLENVPVKFQTCGDVGMTFPIAKGSAVLLMFSDGSLEKFLQLGTPGLATIDTGEFHQHLLQDAFAVPGLDKTTQVRDGAVVIAGDDLRLGDKDADDGVVRLSDLEALESVIEGAGVGTSDGGLVLLNALKLWSATASTKVKVE